jgi:DNA-directed RNA polymerase specialized sigma24 family protein
MSQDSSPENVGEFGPFPVTPWTLVGQAGAVGKEARRQALGRLIQQYMPALRAHLVFRKRVRGSDADDLLQNFVADKVVEQQLVSLADRQRGKFRTFLLTALDRYATSQHRKETARKRSPEKGSPTDIDAVTEPAAPSAPAAAFETEWARQVLDQAITAMQNECAQSGRPELWALFDGRVLCVARGEEPASFDELARHTSKLSPVQISNLLVTAKRMFARQLRQVIGQYALESQIEEELADLRSIVSKGT